MGKIVPLPEVEKEKKSKEEELFSELFHSCYSDLYYYGLKISRDEELTKDCIQDLFAALWKSRERLTQIRSVKFYLLKSLRRSIIRVSQKNKKKIIQANLFSSYEPNIEFSHEELMIGQETSDTKNQELTHLLNSLPKRQKEVIYLKYYENLSYEEIAEILQLNYQSVLNHIHKAFKSIRNKGMLPAWLVLLLVIQQAKALQKKYFLEKEYETIENDSFYKKNCLNTHNES